MADFIIRNGFLTVRIASLGAEMQSIIDARGKERLWQGDPQFWAGRAPVLFPFAGGLKNGYFEHGGKRYDMPENHGFARACEFRCADAKEDRIRFILDRDIPTYPFKYAFCVTYALEEDRIIITYDTKNTGESELHFAVGAHEAYALASDVSRYALVFDEDEDLRAYILQGAQRTHDSVPLTDDKRRLPLHDDWFVRLQTIALKDVRSRGVTLVSGIDDSTVRVDFDGFDHLLLWKKPDAQYLCIEPWVNPPEFVDGPQRLSEKSGIVTLAPGESKAFTHSITFR